MSEFQERMDVWEDGVREALDVERFRAYLRINSEKEFRASMACLCPVAEYLQAALPVEGAVARVYSESTALYHKTEGYQLAGSVGLPQVFVDFISELDEQYGTTSVSGEEALGILYPLLS